MDKSHRLTHHWYCFLKMKEKLYTFGGCSSVCMDWLTGSGGGRVAGSNPGSDKMWTVFW